MVSVPVVSVNETSSVTVTVPSMMISSEPIGSTPSLQLFRSDHTPVGPPTHEIVQVSTGWFPEIVPVITPAQSLFIVPEVLKRVVEMLMVPELLMMPELERPLPAIF